MARPSTLTNYISRCKTSRSILHSCGLIPTNVVEVAVAANESKCGCHPEAGDPLYAFCSGDAPPDSPCFDVPEGGWAEIHVDALPEGTKICVFEKICVCGKPDKHLPLVVGGLQIGIQSGCTSAVIPKGGQYYLQFTGADIDFDAIVIPHTDLGGLNTLLQCGGCG